MTPRKPAKAKILTVNEPKQFDFDAYIMKVRDRRPVFTRNLYLAADLVPRLSELDLLIDDLTVRLEKVETAEGDNVERSVTDVNVPLQLRTRLVELTDEFNRLAQEYQDSADPYTFRMPDQKKDRLAVDELMKADGVWLEKLPDHPDAANEYADLAAVYSMSLTCTSHPMTVAQWMELREAVGEAAFMSLATAWVEAVKASQPSAPFSPKPLPSPVTAG